MEPSYKTEKINLVISLGILAATGIAVAILLATGRFGKICTDLYCIFETREQLRAYIESWGAWAPVALVFVQALQVVIAPIPGELTGAVGGFIFGVWPATIYSTIGLGIGSALAFLLARVIGLPLVRLMVSESLMEKFHFLVESRGTFIALILFTIPGFPKDILCFLLGLSPMSFIAFVTICTLGRIPGTIMLSYGGSAVYDENWGLLVVVTLASLVTIGFFIMKRTKVESWLRRRQATTSSEAGTDGN